MSTLKIPLKFDFSFSSDSAGTYPHTNIPGSFLCSLALGLFIFSLLSGTISFWEGRGTTIIPSFRYGLVASTVLLVVGILQNGSLKLSYFTNLWGYAATLMFLFLSDWLVRNYNLIQGPLIRGEIIIGLGVSLLILHKKFYSFWKIFLFCSVLLLIYTFFSTSAGRVIFSDDHASFVYRLTLLKENFPNIPFYNPNWNGGFDARDFFATGVLAPFFLFYPLIHLFDVQTVYNLILISSLFILLPISVWFTGNSYGCSKLVKVLAAILSLGVSLLWYRWTLKYGTLGFTVSASLIPLNIALLSHFLSPNHKLAAKTLVLFFIIFSLTLLWPGSAVAFVPFYIVALIQLPTLIRSKVKLLWLIVLVLLHVNWMIPFMHVSKVTNFLVSESSHYPEKDSIDVAPIDDSRLKDKKLFKMKAGGINLTDALSHLREQSVSANPLLIFLGLPGLFLIRDRYLRGLLLATSTWFFIAGALLYTIKPQLELDRLLILLLMILCVPTALAIEKLWQTTSESKSKLIASSLIGGFVFATPLSVTSVLSNRSVEQYYFASPLVENLSTAINEHGGNGRVLFSGFVLQDISGGHVAPLAAMVDKPLITAAFYHTEWWYTDVMPESFRKRGDEGVSEFLDIYNVSAVVAHENFWKQYFSQRPDKYKLVWSYERFKIFEVVNYKSTYFYEGQGEVLKQESNLVKLKLKTPDAVVKFKYFPFLTIVYGINGTAKISGCTISLFKIHNEIDFVKLNNCPTDTALTLKSVGTWKRVVNRL